MSMGIRIYTPQPAGCLCIYHPPAARRTGKKRAVQFPHADMMVPVYEEVALPTGNKFYVGPWHVASCSAVSCSLTDGTEGLHFSAL